MRKRMALVLLVAWLSLGAGLAGAQTAGAEGTRPPEVTIPAPVLGPLPRPATPDEARPAVSAGQPPTFLNMAMQGTWPFDLGFRATGFIDQGFTWNPQNPPDRFNGPVACNDRANDYLLDEVYLAFSRSIDPRSGLVDFGFQADILYGSDAFFFSTFGLDNQLVSDDVSAIYKLSFPQFYGDLFLPVGQGLTIRVGHFYSVMGYELQLSPDHFFYSYGLLAFYAIPFQHTGVQCYYSFSDRLTVSSGFNRGWQNFEDNNNALSYMGSLTWTSPSKKTQFNAAIIVGPEQDEPQKRFSGVTALPGESLNRIQYTLWVKQQLGKRWEYAIHHDYGYQELSRAGPDRETQWYGIAQFLTCKLTDKLGVGLRGEWFRDDDGARVIGFRTFNTAAPGSYCEVTLGLNWKPRPWVIVKPELRCDWQVRDDPSATPAYNGGRSTSQFLAALELVVKF